jgi:hypothetical protein
MSLAIRRRNLSKWLRKSFEDGDVPSSEEIESAGIALLRGSGVDKKQRNPVPGVDTG